MSTTALTSTMTLGRVEALKAQRRTFRFTPGNNKTPKPYQATAFAAFATRHSGVVVEAVQHLFDKVLEEPSRYGEWKSEGAFPVWEYNFCLEGPGGVWLNTRIVAYFHEASDSLRILEAGAWIKPAEEPEPEI